jgi:hypothetical protein
VKNSHIKILQIFDPNLGPSSGTVTSIQNLMDNNSNLTLRILELSISWCLEFIRGYFDQTNLLDFLVPHKFVSGGNLMNGISFEMASCQVFIGFDHF